MELKNCYVGKIIQDDHGIPVNIVGLAFNTMGDVVLKVQYPDVAHVQVDALASTMSVSREIISRIEYCQYVQKTSPNDRTVLTHPNNCSDV